MKTKRFLFAMGAMLIASFAGFAQNYTSCGCKPLSQRTEVNLSTKADASHNLKKNTTLYCDTVYVLDSILYVDSAKVLTIEAGTVVRGKEKGLTQTNCNALVICRFGKLIAVGSEYCPIIFTAYDDPLDGTYKVCNQGKWGGILMLGRAYNNILDIDEHNPTNPIGIADGLGTIEGLFHPDQRHWYGADIKNSGKLIGPANTSFVNDDNSGILEYVSIRHGGQIIGAANEVNGLTLGSVGSGTTLRHIEVVANQDDGIEFFGGTVDLKYANILFCDDDYIDYDQGYHGRIQFVLAVERPLIAAGLLDDNGIEADGDDGGKPGRPIYVNGDTLSNPVIYNATFIGRNKTGDNGTEAKANNMGKINSSLFINYNTGIKCAAGISAAQTFFTDCGFVNSATMNSGCTNLVRCAALTGTGIDYTFTIDNTTNCLLSGAYQPVPLPGTVNAGAEPPADGFFTKTAYEGAFDPDADNTWTNEWAYSEKLKVDGSCVDCPTDITGDGTTNVNDFLELVGKYGQNCTN